MLSEADLERPLIYVAGGIGITPLMAMLSHFVERVSLCEYGICPGTQALQTFPVKGWLTGTGCIDKGGLGRSMRLVVAIAGTKLATEGSQGCCQTAILSKQHCRASLQIRAR